MATTKDILSRAISKKKPADEEPDDENDDEVDEEDEEEAQADEGEAEEDNPPPRQPRMAVRTTGQPMRQPQQAPQQFQRPRPIPPPAPSGNPQPQQPLTPQQIYTVAVRDLIAKGQFLEAYDIGVMNNYNGSDLVILHDINNTPRFVIVMNPQNRDKVLNTLGKAFE